MASEMRITTPYESCGESLLRFVRLSLPRPPTSVNLAASKFLEMSDRTLEGFAFDPTSHLRPQLIRGTFNPSMKALYNDQSIMRIHVGVTMSKGYPRSRLPLDSFRGSRPTNGASPFRA